MISLSTHSIFNTSQVNDCIWVIGIDDPSSKIEIKFKEFSFGSGNSLTIGNGLDPTNSSTNIFTRSGYSILRTLSSESSFVWIATKITDSSNPATFDIEASPYIDDGMWVCKL